MADRQPGSQFWGTGDELAMCRDKDKAKDSFAKLTKKQRTAKVAADKLIEITMAQVRRDTIKDQKYGSRI